jgi:DNA-binding transcriptional MerR regulator
MEGMELRVGQLARQTGLTVRTLHHWDDIGLLKPSRRTPAGHRLYAPSHIRRLQQILSLRTLGLGLGEIRTLLEGRSASLVKILEVHRERVRKQLDLLEDLAGRLDRMLDKLRHQETLTQEELLHTMERMAMIEKHFTPEQLEALKRSRTTLGQDEIQKVQEEWPLLINSVREAMNDGRDPASEEVQAMARRWKELVELFSGGDPGIEASVGSMFQAQPEVAAEHGLDPQLFRYIGQAMNPDGKEES